MPSCSTLTTNKTRHPGPEHFYRHCKKTKMSLDLLKHWLMHTHTHAHFRVNIISSYILQLQWGTVEAVQAMAVIHTHTRTKGAVTYLFCVVTMFFFCDTDVLIHCKQTNIIHQLLSIHFSWTSTVMHQMNKMPLSSFTWEKQTDRRCLWVCLCVQRVCMRQCVSLCVCMKERPWETQRHTDSERETWYTALLTFSIGEVNAWSPH